MDCAGYSNRGGRENNEDACKAWGDDETLYAVVADGLGGHGGGSLAARIIVDTLQEKLHQNSGWAATEDEICEIAEKMNDRILAAQTDECRMKSTIVFFYLDQKQKLARWMHMGDSRLYHFEDGRIVFYTFDHSVPRMLAFRGEISMEQIRFHEDRNRVLKALGSDPMPKPEIDSCSLNDKKHAFLLCTDGFWEYVTEDVMETTLAVSRTPKQWLDRMRRHLCSVAKEKYDNHSAIAVWL